MPQIFSRYTKFRVRKTVDYTGAVLFQLSDAKQLSDLLVNIDLLPVTSELLTITLIDGETGTRYLLNSVDPSVSTGSTWDLWMSVELSLAKGDVIEVAYPNTDTNTVSVLTHHIS